MTNKVIPTCNQEFFDVFDNKEFKELVDDLNDNGFETTEKVFGSKESRMALALTFVNKKVSPSVLAERIKKFIKER